jgi:hypothetical protein
MTTLRLLLAFPINIYGLSVGLRVLKDARLKRIQREVWSNFSFLKEAAPLVVS